MENEVIDVSQDPTNETSGNVTENNSSNEENVDNGYTKQVMDLKLAYEKKISEQSEKYEKAIEERDNLIKQLLTDEKQNISVSVADMVNRKREYKKW